MNNMKKLLFKNWLVLMSLVMACGFTACDDDDDNVGTTPIFPEKQEINLAAGGSQEFSFEANTNWSLSSSAIWCVFVKDEVESFVLSGTPGKQTVTVKMTDDAPVHETSVAKLELTMGGEKVVIGEVRREAQGYDLQIFDEEGNPITELEASYIGYKKFKVKANFRFAVTNKPSWVDLEGNVLVGGSNKEVTGGLGINNNDDANLGKYAITKDDGYTLTFASEDGMHEEKVPVVFNGMPTDDIDITDGPASNKWSWTISEDGKTFTNGAGVSGGGGTSYNGHVSFTLKARNDDFKIVMIDEYTLNDELQLEIMSEPGWMQYAIYDKCKVNLTAEKLPNSSKRTAYVLAFPSAKYEGIKDDIIGNAFDETGELKYEYERYLLMIATQEIIEDTSGPEFKVTYWDEETSANKEIEVTKYLDHDPDLDPDEFNVPIQTFEAEVGKSYDVDPLLGIFGNDWKCGAMWENPAITVEGIDGTQTATITINSEFSENFKIMFMDSGDAIKKILVVTLKK